MTTPTHYYNQGNALYAQGKYAEALTFSLQRNHLQSREHTVMHRAG